MSRAVKKPADENLRWVVAATLLGVGYVIWKNRSNAHEALGVAAIGFATIGAPPPDRDPSVRHHAMLAHLKKRVAAMEAARTALPPGPERLAAWTRYQRQYHARSLLRPPR